VSRGAPDRGPARSDRGSRRPGLRGL
jgi:hypothetical protein